MYCAHVQIVSVIVISSVMIKKPRVTPERAAVPAARNVTKLTSFGFSSKVARKHRFLGIF